MGLRWRVPTALGAAIAVAGLVLVSTAFATPPPGHKVTICHATNSDTNPYIQETVDIASSGYLQAGHNDHTGPVWYEGAKDAKVKWGDIIPPYTYAPTTFDYPGLNWTDEGKAIWDDDCAIVTESETANASESTLPTETTPPTESPTFGGSVGALTDSPTDPPTDTTAPASAPNGGAAALLAFLGLLLASLVLVTPRASRAS